MSDATTKRPRRFFRYKAPDSIPATTVCRVLRIPNDPAIIAAVYEVVSYLTLEGVWESSAGVHEFEMMSMLTEMWYDFSESDCNPQ